MTARALIPMKKTVRVLRAAWLAFRIWTPGVSWRYNAEEPFCSISIKTAWSVAAGIWCDEFKQK